jgi:23S rRNA (pseudouridine1915-N3)-methyltransferase
MKVELWQIGKTAFPYLRTGIELYEKRLKHYLKFQIVTFPDIKNAQKLSPALLKDKEAEQLLKKLKSDDYLVLLDERGKQHSSVEFARFIEKRFMGGHKRLIFLIGGAFGASEGLKQRANLQLSISRMTFSHQLIRLLFLEQLYRGMTIIRNEPYHNE